MLINEPIAALRTLSATLYDTGGVLLDLSTSWPTGSVKVSRNGAAFVDAVGAPVAVTGGGDGAFDLQLALGEVNALGSVRVRFYDALDNLLGDFADTVEATPDDFITLSTAVASERVLDATLYDVSSLALLPASTVWLAGMVKVSKAGGAFVNAAALPTASAGDGAFSLQLTQAEVSSPGNLRVRFFDAPGGQVLAEFITPVRAAVASGVSLPTPPALAGGAALRRIRKEVGNGLVRAGLTRPALLIVVSPGARDPANVTAGRPLTETAVKARGFVVQWSKEYGFSSQVVVTDRIVLLVGSKVKAVPKVGDRITIEGVTSRIVEVGRDPAQATYPCATRS